MTSEHGVRLTLRLGSVDAARVLYAGSVEVPGARFDVTAVVDAATGAVAVEGAEGAPRTAVERLEALLRSVWRASRAGTPWPRRLSRWRGEKERE
jgi:hypothetical protein